MDMGVEVGVVFQMMTEINLNVNTVGTRDTPRIAVGIYMAALRSFRVILFSVALILESVVVHNLLVVVDQVLIQCP